MADRARLRGAAASQHELGLLHDLQEAAQRHGPDRFPRARPARSQLRMHRRRRALPHSSGQFRERVAVHAAASRRERARHGPRFGARRIWIGRGQARATPCSSIFSASRSRAGPSKPRRRWPAQRSCWSSSSALRRLRQSGALRKASALGICGKPRDAARAGSRLPSRGRIAQGRGRSPDAMGRASAVVDGDALACCRSQRPGWSRDHFPNARETAGSGPACGCCGRARLSCWRSWRPASRMSFSFRR